MKRIIAAALSLLVGAFGYTIVDSAIEDRVSTLESRVVELEGEVSKYHPQNNWYTTAPDSTTTTTGYNVVSTTRHITTTETTTELHVGDYLRITSNPRTKFLLRRWSDGWITYISPNNYSEPTSVAYRPTMTIRETTTTTSLYEDLSSSPQHILTDPMDGRLTNTITSQSYKDYFLYITDSSAQIKDVSSKEKYSYWYNQDYSKVSTMYTSPMTSVEFVFRGYTDPVFAGNTFTLNLGMYFYYGDYTEEISVTGVIDSDGSFELRRVYDFNGRLDRFVNSYYYVSSVTMRNNVTTRVTTTRATTATVANNGIANPTDSRLETTTSSKATTTTRRETSVSY